MAGDFSANHDEGYKNIAHRLADRLAMAHDVTRINIKEIRSRRFWRCVVASRPDVVHVLGQPTTQSVLLARFLSVVCGPRAVVFSALRAERYLEGLKASGPLSGVISHLHPTRVIVQSAGAAQAFEALGWKSALVPNGVDLDRFTPLSRSAVQAVRTRWGIEPRAQLVLHAGHLTPERNVRVLASLCRPGRHVMLVVSTSQHSSSALASELRRAGVEIVERYVDDIGELMAAADCYVFPTPPMSTISMPLSVLEAMACDVPVVTTRAPGIIQFVGASPSFQFADSEEEMRVAVEAVLAYPPTFSNRANVAQFSWDRVAQDLTRIYVEVTEQ